GATDGRNSPTGLRPAEPPEPGPRLLRMTPPALRFTVVAVALSALLAGCRGTHAPHVSLEGVPSTELRRAKSNVRVFDAAWSCIADEYYDRTLRGVDWDAAGRKYGPQAAAAA